jgi:hypothetical protein
MRAALVQAETPEAEQRTLVAAASLNSSEKKLCERLTINQPVHIDDIVERSSLNSSEVLATLFERDRKATAGKAVCEGPAVGPRKLL